MDPNVGGIDRTARLIAGPILLLVGIAALLEVEPLAFGTVAGGLAALVGVIFLGTGLSRRCIINRLLGVNTFRG